MSGSNPDAALDAPWLTRAIDLVTADARFRRNARDFNGVVYAHIEEEPGAHVCFHAGVPGTVTSGAPTGAPIVLSGSRETWEKALAAAVDLPSAARVLTLTGDRLALAGNALALNALWQAMRHASGVPEAIRPSDPVENHREELIGRYVWVGNNRTYYESEGEGRPIVCVHSGGADGRQYRHLLPFLAGLGFRAIAVDMPGHGKSYPDLADGSLLTTGDGWRAFVLDFCARLGLQQPAFVGCAMSASFLLQLAAETPKSLSALVCVNGRVDHRGVSGEEFLDFLNHPQINVADYMESMTAGLLGRNLPASRKNECFWHNARALTPEVMHADLAPYDHHDVTDLLSHIAVPVLYVYGEVDPANTVENLEAVANGIKHVHVVKVPGSGHLPMLEDPELLNDQVGRFLTGVM